MSRFSRRSRWLARMAVVLGALLVGCVAPAKADVILATDGSVTYDSSTGDFNVSANGLFFLSDSLPGDPGQVPISSGTADLLLSVDQNGALVGPGSLMLTGGIDFDQDGINDVSGALVVATVNAFNPSGAGPAPWGFLGQFTFTGGSLTQASIPLSGGGTFSDTYAVGQTGTFDLIIEQQVSGILGDFLSNFSGQSVKGPVVFSVPEPASGCLLIAGLATIAGVGLFRRNPRRSA
jgi:PEP-CTERM motif